MNQTAIAATVNDRTAGAVADTSQSMPNRPWLAYRAGPPHRQVREPDSASGGPGDVLSRSQSFLTPDGGQGGTTQPR
jgi:hypothetical protein